MKKEHDAAFFTWGKVLPRVILRLIFIGAAVYLIWDSILFDLLFGVQFYAWVILLAIAFNVLIAFLGRWDSQEARFLYPSWVLLATDALSASVSEELWARYLPTVVGYFILDYFSLDGSLLDGILQFLTEFVYAPLSVVHQEVTPEILLAIVCYICVYSIAGVFFVLVHRPKSVLEFVVRFAWAIIWSASFYFGGIFASASAHFFNNVILNGVEN